MISGTTRSGFEYTVDERILTDWRFTMALTKTQNGKNELEQIAGAQEMVVLMLGKEGVEALTSHIAEANDGFVPADAVMNEVKEMLENAKPAKN